MKSLTLALLALIALGITACHNAVIDRTDRSVYRLIEQRQRAALGTTSDVHVGAETGDLGAFDRMYSLTPHPVESSLPEAFRASPPPDTNAEPSAGPAAERPDAPTDANREEEPSAAGTGLEGDPDSQRDEPADDGAAPSQDLTADIFTPEQMLAVRVFGLHDALAYAMAHGRQLQDAKEDLYLAALDLTLERHLWTPQFVATIQASFADYGQVRDFDRAMSAVSNIAVTQRLPYGGEVGARVINSLMRDLGVHVTSGESGSAILDANIPLFRGAGRVARESRYQTERNMIYAVRDYERFRRTFLVEIAGAYFRLQQGQAEITNTFRSYLTRRTSSAKEDLVTELKQNRDVFDALRATSSLRSAETSLVRAKARYQADLDQFKIRLGMPIDLLLDVVPQDDDTESALLERLLSDVTEEEAIAIALASRLDLLNTLDGVDDARRNVKLAESGLLPDLDFTGSVALDTDANQKNSLSYNTERSTWRAQLNLRIDDRKTERNAYRDALIRWRRRQRARDETIDRVRADVRSATRNLNLEDDLTMIQELDLKQNEFRLAASTEQNRLGMITNQDVVDAEDDLLRARNGYADAVASFRRAILRFRLATGTLRVTDDGRWAE